MKSSIRNSITSSRWRTPFTEFPFRFNCSRIWRYHIFWHRGGTKYKIKWWNTSHEEHPKRTAEEQTQNNHDLPTDEGTSYEEPARRDGGNETVQRIAKPEMGSALQILSGKSWIWRYANYYRIGRAVNTLRQFCFSISSFSPPDGNNISVISQFKIELLSIRAVLVLFRVVSTANIVGMITQNFSLPLYSPFMVTEMSTVTNQEDTFMKALSLTVV